MNKANTTMSFGTKNKDKMKIDSMHIAKKKDEIKRKLRLEISQVFH